MKKALLVLLIVFMTASFCACGNPKSETVADPIMGRWTLIKMVDESGEDDATGMNTVYTFEKDGTVTGIDNGKAVTGTWKKADTSVYVVSISDTNMKFTLEEDNLTYQMNLGVSTIDCIFERK